MPSRLFSTRRAQNASTFAWLNSRRNTQVSFSFQSARAMITNSIQA